MITAYSTRRIRRRSGKLLSMGYLPACVVLVAMLSAAVFGDPPATEPTTAPTTVPTTQPIRRLGIRVEDLSEGPDGEDQVWLFGGNLRIRIVIEGSRAEQMGILRGDIIKRINGKEVKTTADVAGEIRASDRVTLDVLRKGKPLQISEPTTRP